MAKVWGFTGWHFQGLAGEGFGDDFGSMFMHLPRLGCSGGWWAWLMGVGNGDSLYAKVIA